jgi:ribose transport system permease protein
MTGSTVVRFVRTRREATVLAMLILVFIGLTFASEFFLTGRNLSNVARQISVVGIVALGQALVIIAGGIDLSVGSVIGLSAVTAAIVSAMTGMPSVGIAGAIGIGMAIGFANGVLITKLRINPFITTLGTLSIARGAALLITNGNPQRFDNWAAYLGHGKIAGVPVQFILLVVLTVLVWLFATRTRWGRNVYAVGDNARAARLAGIDVARTRILVFTVSGSLAGLGGLLLGGMLTNANPNPRRRRTVRRSGLDRRRRHRRGADRPAPQRVRPAQRLGLLADHHHWSRRHPRRRRGQPEPAQRRRLRRLAEPSPQPIPIHTWRKP